MQPSSKYFHPEVLARISRLELRARHVVEGFVSGMHASPFRGFSIEFAAHRAYAPGDDTRHIDWRVYAKSDRFFVKEYEVETNVRTHVLLDCSGSMAYPDEVTDDRLSKWDYAATVAVSLAHMLVVLQSDAAGVALFDDVIRVQTKCSSNRSSLAELCDVVESARPTGKSDSRIPFEEIAERVPKRGLVVVVSDLLMDVDALQDGLARLQSAHHDVIVLHVLDRDELEFPFTDRTQFIGMEDANVQIMTDPQALRKAYLESVQAYVARLRKWCYSRRMGYALLSTADPVDNALSAYLAGRMHRLSKGA